MRIGCHGLSFKKLVEPKSRHIPIGEQSQLKKEVRLGLVDPISKSKPPILHWIGGQWRLWTTYNQTLTEGTYILLGENGSLTRINANSDGTHSENRI